MAGRRGGMGIVVYTGSVPPAAPFLESLAGVQLQGYDAAALLSFSFRSEHGGKGAVVIGGIPVIPNPDDESA
ncbi:hypothetical protein HYR69_10775, partial [Candidatus Sumerlaeota bacterium]|nr:hypothetical protein [Candidatus Sumerlaeota bacterium]